MKKALSNLALLLLGFAVWVIWDYFYVKSGGQNSAWARHDSWILLFPVIVFAANWFLWRTVTTGFRIIISLGFALALSALEVVLVLFIGIPIHVSFGGTL